MNTRTLIRAGLTSLSLAIAIATHTPAQMNHDEMTSTTPGNGQFQRIEQPLSSHIAVTGAGLSLIGLELWWFLLSKPKSRKAATSGGIQTIDITVDGGYDPSRIVVQAGQTVRLNFNRQDPSSCLDEVRFPDFRIAQALPLNQVTTIEFTPEKPGSYEFTCGMNMFRGVVEVQAEEQTETAALVPQTTHAVAPAQHHAEHAASSASSLEANLTAAGIQEATVAVAKGYQPKRIIVEAGHPVRLQFDRQNPSRCYDQLLIPDFGIAVDLEPATTVVEFTPEHPGEYEFTCGMQMNRGVIEVHAPHFSQAEKAVA